MSCPDRAMAGSRFCERHARVGERRPDGRPSAARRGYDRKWRRIRAAFLRKYPDCAVCGEAADQVDHVIPLAEGGSNKHENLQALCSTHHSQKTNFLDGGFGRERVRWYEVKNEG